MKEELIEEIKTLIKSSKDDEIFINPNYLNYFTQDELVEIRDNLILKKSEFSQSNFTYLEEIYQKTKKDKL